MTGVQTCALPISPHSGDWLQAPSIASVELLLSDEEIRLAVAYRLGNRACSSYTCACGKAVDARGLHGLSCRRSTPRHQRNSMINDIIWGAIKRAKIPTHKEPTGLIMQNGKRPDGATLISWSEAKLWHGLDSGQICSVSSSIHGTWSRQSSDTCSGDEMHKIQRTRRHAHIAIETTGTWDKQATELIEEIGRRCTLETEDPKETIYLYQRISIAIQRGNALSFTHTFDIYADINT